MIDRKKAVIGALVGDAMSLGPHWIYDTKKLKNNFYPIKGLTNPLEDSFHKNKTKGDFTHLGDQLILLLNFLEEKEEFSRKDFLFEFRKWYKDYSGYKDKSMKKTIKNIDDEKFVGSNSDEFSGIKIIPILYYYYGQNFDELKLKSKEVIKATHNNPFVIEIGNFFIKLLKEVEKGVSPSQGVENIKDKFSNKINKYIMKAKKNLEKDTNKSINRLGQMCSSEASLPSTLYLLFKYENSFEKAILKNILAGGDSAARGIIIGSILAQYHGIEKIPDNWINDINQIDYIKKILSINL
ncbi:MAG: ADP-ribosylglycohydrolase family protein [Bacillota bacterium]